MGPRGGLALRTAGLLCGILGLGWLATGAVAASSEPSPALAFEQPHAEFGIVHQRAMVEQVYPFVNRGDKPVAILAVRPRFEGGTGEAVPRVVPAGGRGEIRVRQSVGDRLGASAFRIALETDDPAAPLLRLGLSGFVESAYEPQAPKLDFGTLFSEQGRELALDLASREVERLEIRGIDGAPGFLDVTSTGRSGELGEGVRLSARVRPGAPIGIHAATVVVRTNVPNQPEVAVPISVTVYGDVVPERNPVSFGLARIGQGLTADVVLRSRSGKAFEIESAVDPEGRIGGEASPCSGEPPDAACRRVTLRGQALVSGPVGGVLNLRISGQEVPLPIRYAGLVTSPNTQVKTIDLTGQPAEVEPPALPFTPVRPSTSTSFPGATASPEPAAGGAPPGRPAAVLRWQASREDGVFGYRVLRSASRLGPFVRISRDLVLVPGGPPAPHSYVFEDFDVAPGATYHYYLDLVTTSGEVRRFSGVLSKTVSSAPASPRTTDAADPPNPPRQP